MIENGAIAYYKEKRNSIASLFIHQGASIMRTTQLISLFTLVAATACASSQPAAPVELSMHKKPAHQPMHASMMAEPAPAAPATPEAAPETAEAPQGSGAIPALPLVVQKSGDISYINGGVGDEELAQFKAQIGLYNLQVMLSTPKGEYISDVRLRVLDQTGAAVLDIADAGPYLYASLPAGSYTLETSAPGTEPKQEKFTVASKGAVRKHIVYNQ